MDKVAETVGMNPIELRILNAYRDGDMKAHRRLAKNCALIECCQVVADKAGVKLSPEMQAAASTRGGGDERARLPARTATDEEGRVTGYRPTNYARKGAPPPDLPGAPVPAAPAAAPAGGTAPPSPPSPASKTPAPARPGALRFSSLSGFRRR